MRQSPPFRKQACAAGAMLAALLFSFATVSDAETTLPDASSNRAKNLARLNCGAHIDRILPGGGIMSVPVASDQNENPAALVLDDNTLSCALSAGETTFIITLPRIAVLERFAFINQNAAAQGEFELAVSNYRLGSKDPKWVLVQSTTPFTGKRLLNVPVVGVEAKYVKLSFHVQKEGRLAGIALYGSRTLENFAQHHVLHARSNYTLAAMRLLNRPEETLNFNFANQYARGRIAYVSSGASQASARMIDDDVSTSFSFSPGDPHPTVVIELGENQNLHRVSAVYHMKKGQLDAFLLNELGKDPADLKGLKPVASVSDQTGRGQAALNFDQRGAHYIALRWTPADPNSGPIEVCEIGAFGALPMSVFSIDEVPTALVDARVQAPPGLPDLSNTLGTLGDPPSGPPNNPPPVPPVSP
jgi:hypothetical protein